MKKLLLLLSELLIIQLAIGQTYVFNGPIQIIDGTQGIGKVLTSDADGLASWKQLLPANAPGMLVNDGNGNLSWQLVTSLIGSTSGLTSNPTPGSTTETWLGAGAGSGGGSNLNTVFIGTNTGFSAASATQSNFIGTNAGWIAEYASNSNFLGYGAGGYAVYAANSCFVGNEAGMEAENAANSIFIGSQSGYNDVVDNTSGGTSILIGDNTSTGGNSNSIALGTNATNNKSNQFTIGASYNNWQIAGVNYVMPGTANAPTNGQVLTAIDNSGTLSWQSVSTLITSLIGSTSGLTSNPTPGSTTETWLGAQAGTNASYNSTVFVGTNAGYSATNANSSTFVGSGAGVNATNAANSIFIGYGSGNNDNVNNTSGGGHSILIGDNTSTSGYSNSIALGTGATNSAANQFTVGSSYNNWQIAGVNYVMPSASANGVLADNGSGALSWEPASSISPFTESDYNVYLDNNSWRVGIGTNTPEAKLEVINNCTTVPLILAQRASVLCEGQAQNNPTDLFPDYFVAKRSPTATEFIVNRMGNLGLGTGTPAALFDEYRSSTSIESTVFHISDYTYGDLIDITRQGEVGIGIQAPQALVDIYSSGAFNNVFHLKDVNYGDLATIDKYGHVGFGKINTGTAMVEISDVNNLGIPQFQVDGGGSDPYLMVKPNSVGVGIDPMTLNGTLALQGNNGTNLDLYEADANQGWNAQIRLISMSENAIRDIITDSGSNGAMLIIPGNAGIAAKRLRIEGDEAIDGSLYVGGNLDLNGKVVLGNVSAPNGYMLYVDSGILTEQLKVAPSNSTDWSDFVFDKGYKLPSFNEVETYIKQNNHLRDIPSEQDVDCEGIDVVKMDAKLLQKIEELTLYVLELKKENDKQSEKIEELTEKIKN